MVALEDERVEHAMVNFSEELERWRGQLEHNDTYPLPRERLTRLSFDLAVQCRRSASGLLGEEADEGALRPFEERLQRSVFSEE